MWVEGVGGAVLTVVAYKGNRARVVDPDRVDPARHFALLKTGLLVLCVIVAIGIWASSDSPFFGTLGVIPAALLYLLGVIGISLGASAWRRSAGYAICENSYASAPRAVKTSMRKIYKSVEEIKSTKSFADGMFGDLELDRLAFGAAQRAVLSSKLRTVTADSSQSQEHAAGSGASSLKNRQIALLAEITGVEHSLARVQSTATKLSFDLSTHARTVEARQADAERGRARENMQSRIENMQSQIDSLAPLDCDSVEERASSVRAGYTEARKISEQASKAPIYKVGNDVAPNGEGQFSETIKYTERRLFNRHQKIWSSVLRK